MKSAFSHRVVLVTVPDLRVARLLARAVLTARVAACVNVLPRMESHYWWQGRIETGRERLLVLKTTQARLAELERVVHAHHPYDTPEFVVLKIHTGSRRYLDWIGASTAGTDAPARRRVARSPEEAKTAKADPCTKV